MLELASYIAFFHHLFYHNNNVAVNVLAPSVIQKRNQVTFGLLTLNDLFFPAYISQAMSKTEKFS